MDVVCRRLQDVAKQELVERPGCWDEDENDIYGVAQLEPRFKFENEPNEW